MTIEKTADASSEPKTIKVDILDAQYELPEEAAKELIALRDKIGKEVLSKGYNNSAAKRAKELEAKVKSYEDADVASRAKQAELERTALEAKAGSTSEVEKIKAWYASELDKTNKASTAEVSKWKSSAIQDKLYAIVKGQDDLVPSAATDVVKNIITDNGFDIGADGKLVAIADGKPRLAENGDPITAEALVAKFIGERDWLKLHKGAKGTTEKKIEKTGTTDQLSHLSPAQRIDLMQRGKLDPNLIISAAQKNARG